METYFDAELIGHFYGMISDPRFFNHDLLLFFIIISMSNLILVLNYHEPPHNKTQPTGRGLLLTYFIGFTPACTGP